MRQRHLGPKCYFGELFHNKSFILHLYVPYNTDTSLPVSAQYTNTWGLVSNHSVSICPPISKLFLKRPILLHMGPEVLCPLSHSLFPMCQSVCEFTHHLCVGSSHGDISSALLSNNLNLQHVVLRNVQLKPNVARKTHAKPASLTSILKPCTWQSWVIYHIQALSYSISAALKPHISHLCLHSANSPCMVLLRQGKQLRRCAHQCSKLSFPKTQKCGFPVFQGDISAADAHFFISVLMSAFLACDLMKD